MADGEEGGPREKFNFDLSSTEHERAERLYAILARSKKFYRYPTGTILFLSEGRFQEQTDPWTFNGSLVSLVSFETGKGKFRSLEYKDLAALLASQARFSLPVIEDIITSPKVFDTGRGPELFKPGLNAIGKYQVYYARHPDPTIIEPEPLPGVEHLKACFAPFPVVGPGDLANVIAWLVGGVVYGNMTTPLLMVNGNMPGLGKTTLIQAVAYILEGKDVAATPAYGSEFSKNVGAKLASTDHIVLLDNVVTRGGREFDNPDLSTYLTQPSTDIRKLGTNEFHSGRQLLFAMSINNARLATDIALRSLVVQLNSERSVPLVPYPLKYARDHRRELYGELLGLALSRPGPVPLPDYSFRFVDWWNTCAPRVSPYFGPLCLSRAAVDAATQEVVDLLGDLQEFTPSDLLTRIDSQVDAYGSIIDRLGKGSERSRITRLGKLLAPLIDVKTAVVGAPAMTLRKRDVKPASYFIERGE